MRFKDFTKDELDILEEALCEYNSGKYLINEIREVRKNKIICFYVLQGLKKDFVKFVQNIIREI